MINMVGFVHGSVTKGRGKRLRIVVKCMQRFDWPDVRLRLLDVTNGPALECADFFVCNDRSTLQVRHHHFANTHHLHRHRQSVLGRLTLHLHND